MIKYGIISEEYSLDGVCRISYGIAVYDTDIGTIIDSVHDISHDKEKVEHFANLCNKLGLSIIHFTEAIEDFLDE